MASIPQMQINGTTYDLKDKRLDKYNQKPILNDLISSSMISAIPILDQTGVLTTGAAWRADKGTVTGTHYKYLTYSIPSGYVGNAIVIFGHGWGAPYPLVCFYDSDMNLISTAGERPDTRYDGLTVVIPEGSSTIVVNGTENDTNMPFGVSFQTLASIVGLFTKIGVCGNAIIDSVVDSCPKYADVRNFPTNCVYDLGDTVYTKIANLPVELNTYATLIKVNGAGSKHMVGGGAYNLYICANERAVWFGFETANSLTWRLVSGSVTPESKYLLIGDSYADGYSHDGNNSGWCEYFAEEMGLTSSQYEAGHRGGVAFSNGGFLSLLNSAVGGNFTDIIVLGGFNDCNESTSDIEAGISTFCSRAKTLFPTAKVHIGCIGWIKAGTGESAYENWQNIRANITGTVIPAYQACAKYGAQYIGLSEYLLTDALMTNTDGYHPGEEGNRVVAHGIINGIATGVACLPYRTVLK